VDADRSVEGAVSGAMHVSAHPSRFLKCEAAPDPKVLDTPAYARGFVPDTKPAVLMFNKEDADMSGEIISGYAFYSRKTKPGDYEHEQADVRLDFNVAEGQTQDAILATAANACKAKVHELLGLKGSTALPPQLASTGPTKADLAAAASAAAGAPKSGTAEEKPKTTRVPKAAAKAEAPAKVEEPAKVETSTDDDMADLLGAEPAPITDVEMVKHAQTTNERIKNAQAIREVTGRYVQPPKGFKDVPQELRAKWKADLDALKPAG